MSKERMTTEKIRLWGIVQGVGFRPYVAKIADRLSMKGEVLNIGGLVDITVTDTEARIDDFIETLLREKPGPSEIVHIKRQKLQPRDFSTFTIIRSDEGDDEAAMIPADLAICPDCLRELYDESNPRYLHPFISCQLCGPRYTIIDRIPYDRDNTSMIDFPMCEFCEGEYIDLHDRRHHAQTISCHECGPVLVWTDRDGAVTTGGDRDTDRAILDKAGDILKSGGVIAFKSVGGYNLVADPFNEDAVAKLREIKNREAKPFAVMFRSLEEIKQYCSVDEVEEKLLQSSARPIILLEHKLNELEEAADYRSFTDLKRSRFIGSFLPSFAAQYLLLDRISPLIFTSANPSDMPMIKDDDEMLRFCERAGKVDGIIANRRRINVRMDDSVVRVIDSQPQMIRRSKGYAPVPLYVSAGSADESAGGDESKFSLLACGGQLKNSFVLTKGPFAYVSQFFGDMDTVENQKIYEENINRMSDLFRIKPQAVVCDIHPLYRPTVFAEQYAEEKGLPLLKVQHHHAHVASVMAENNLEGKVIGVAFDGTGYGTDGAIWGGEFLLCEDGEFERVAHMKYVDMIGGDSSMKDARRSALSYMAAYRKGYLDDGNEGEIRLDISDIIEFGAAQIAGCPDSLLIMKALDKGVNAIRSSSMGRLFDGVSALLGIKDYNDYEGQCAIMLEDAAAFAQKHPGVDRASDLALSFHERVTDMIVTECDKIGRDTGAKQVALTGGTFQNKILMEGVVERLRAKGFEVYYNISVSPNDGGIALGQAFVGMHKLRAET
ncbi:MAG: carbamoyltransferase HypF [Clostridiales bacterium]|nr:carbamoyltransferase HypF [Clostridiales bacterium]